MDQSHLPTYDFIVIGSGFGGSVAAMRLTEKGYRVLVLERGKRFRDEDFARSNWSVQKYLWAPALRCFGIFQITLLNGMMILHGSGVGGGSLGYSNVLEVPDDRLFASPAWKHLADWKSILQPHYETAIRMLGVTTNPCLWPADQTLLTIAKSLGQEKTFRPTRVGVFFGEDGSDSQEVLDPYFGGEGPPRGGCIHCGACMVGCRHNAKNTLVKNYLYFADKWGAEVRPECMVRDLRPLPEDQPDGARYEVIYHSATAWPFRPVTKLRARSVILSAGVLGTLRLLFRCRDETRSLPDLSPTLGEMVRTNSEELLGVINRDSRTDYSKGVSITSVFHADPDTAVEPVRYPDGSSLLRLISAPLIDADNRLWVRWLKVAGTLLAHPIDALRRYVLPGWAHNTTILLVMQTRDNRLRARLGRGISTLFRRGLLLHPAEGEQPPVKIELAHQIAHDFARLIGGIPAGSIGESLLNIPSTAHILGGCPIGLTAEDSVVGLGFQVHNYPGLYVVDGSVMPANPGINPSLTITALAEYAMSHIPPRS